jgi:hypothetical protein
MVKGVNRQKLGATTAMSTTQEYVIDGNDLNKKLESLNLEAYQPTGELHRMLTGQVFETVEKKVIKRIADEIQKNKPQTVRFVNLEALASGPHKEYLNPICGCLAVLIEGLTAKGIQAIGTIQNPMLLPWHLVAKLDKNFKGLPAPGQTEPP